MKNYLEKIKNNRYFNYKKISSFYTKSLFLVIVCNALFNSLQTVEAAEPLIVKAVSKSCYSFYFPEKLKNGKYYIQELIDQNKKDFPIQYFQSPSKRFMPYFSRESNPNKDEVQVILIHGLGDNVESMRSLATLMMKHSGKNIYSVGQYGSDLNQVRRWGQKRKIPDEIDYKLSVQDIVDFIQSKGMKNVLIVGHSLGGAIGTAVVAELNKRNQLDPNNKIKTTLVFAAGYVKAIDQYLTDSATAGGYLINQFQSVLKWFYPKDFVEVMEDNFLKYQETVAGFSDFYKDHVVALTGVDKVDDVIFENLKVFMKKAYTSYFELINEKKKLNLSNKDIGYLVDVAIAMTKGARGFDLLNFADKEGISELISGTPILVLGGMQDELVTKDQLKTVLLRFQGQPGRAENSVNLVMLDGPGSIHLFPQTMALETMLQIFEFMRLQNIN